MTRLWVISPRECAKICVASESAAAARQQPRTLLPYVQQCHASRSAPAPTAGAIPGRCSPEVSARTPSGVSIKQIHFRGENNALPPTPPPDWQEYRWQSLANRSSRLPALQSANLRGMTTARTYRHGHIVHEVLPQSENRSSQHLLSVLPFPPLPARTHPGDRNFPPEPVSRLADQPSGRPRSGPCAVFRAL